MFLPLRSEMPQLRRPAATLVLLAVNAAVFLYELTLGPPALLRLARAAGVVPWEVAHFTDLVDRVQPHDLVPPPFTIFTSMFLHGDPLHLAGNLWFLWVFGARLEGLVGPWRFVAHYFVAGTLAAILQVSALPQSVMPMIGASGAIAGVLGAHARAFPREPVRCLVFVVCFVTLVRLPAAVILGLWFVAQLASVNGAAAGVAWYAHIGGFVAGFLLACLFVDAPRRRGYAYHRRRESQARRGSSGDGYAWPNAPVPTT